MATRRRTDDIAGIPKPTPTPPLLRLHVDGLAVSARQEDVQRRLGVDRPVLLGGLTRARTAARPSLK